MSLDSVYTFCTGLVVRVAMKTLGRKVPKITRGVETTASGVNISTLHLVVAMLYKTENALVLMVRKGSTAATMLSTD